MPAADILLRIVEQRRRRLDVESAVGSSVAADQSSPLFDSRFVDAIGSRKGHAIIAEIKMGSPSLGSLENRVRPLEQARVYAANGAAALSVVVEPDFFRGSYELLAACREASGLPTIAKDFLVHPVQVEQAVAAGADAMLLIAALYAREELGAWTDLIRAHGLVPLVETHSPQDVAKLVGRDWELVGVNNRDLRTFQVDLEHSIERVRHLPAGALKVAESGIRDGDEIDRLAVAGFDGFLIGETLLLADDPAASLRELARIPRSRSAADLLPP